MSTSNNVKMSGMPHHTTHFLPLSLDPMRFIVPVWVLLSVEYCMAFQAWARKKVHFKTQRQ